MVVESATNDDSSRCRRRIRRIPPVTKIHDDAKNPGRYDRPSARQEGGARGSTGFVGVPLRGGDPSWRRAMRSYIPQHPRAERGDSTRFSERHCTAQHDAVSQALGSAEQREKLVHLSGVFEGFGQHLRSAWSLRFCGRVAARARTCGVRQDGIEREHGDARRLARAHALHETASLTP